MRKFIIFLAILLATSQAWSQVSGDSAVVWKIEVGVNSIDVSPDGTYFAVANGDGNFKMYNTSDGSFRNQVKAHNGSVNCVRFSSDGLYIVTTSNSNHEVKVWNTSDWTLFKTLNYPLIEDPMHAIFSHNNKYLAVCSGYQGFKIWDIESWQLIKTIKPEDGGTNNGPMPESIEFSPNDSLLALSAMFNPGRVYDFYTDSTIIRSTTASFYSTFSRDGKKFIAGYYNDGYHTDNGAGVDIYDINTKELLAHIPLKDQIKDADISFDNKYLVFGYNRLYIYDLTNNFLQYDLPYYSNKVNFIPNTNNILISGGNFVVKYNFDKITDVANSTPVSNNKILQVFPNPGNTNITIKYEISNPQIVNVIIEDINGNTTSKIYDGITEAGIHTLTWKIDSIANGVYFVKLRLENSFNSQKFVVNK